MLLLGSLLLLVWHAPPAVAYYASYIFSVFSYNAWHYHLLRSTYYFHEDPTLPQTRLLTFTTHFAVCRSLCVC